MAKGIKVTDGIKVANQLTLKWDISLDYVNKPNVITVVLKSGRRRKKLGNWKLPGAGGWEKWRDICQNVQTFSYKMNKFWGSNVQHCYYS